jgi:hypothetical protein
VLKAAKQLEGLECTVLVPNRRGFDLAMNAGADRLGLFMSVTESHNKANLNRTREESFAELSAIVRGAPKGTKFRFNLSCVFHCPFEGVVPEPDALDWIERVVALDPHMEIALADTTGNAAPDQVRRVFEHAHRSWGQRFAFHGHDTYGMGLANVTAAREAGVPHLRRRFGRHRRLPLRPRRHRQRRHGGRGVALYPHGGGNRHGLDEAAVGGGPRRGGAGRHAGRGDAAGAGGTAGGLTAEPKSPPPHPVTPDGRYFVVRGRLWRMANPACRRKRRAELTRELMAARRGVAAANRAGDAAALRAARAGRGRGQARAGRARPGVVDGRGAGLQPPPRPQHALCRMARRFGRRRRGRMNTPPAARGRSAPGGRGLAGGGSRRAASPERPAERAVGRPASRQPVSRRSAGWRCPAPWPRPQAPLGPAAASPRKSPCR